MNSSHHPHHHREERGAAAAAGEQSNQLLGKEKQQQPLREKQRSDHNTGPSGSSGQSARTTGHYQQEKQRPDQNPAAASSSKPDHNQQHQHRKAASKVPFSHKHPAARIALMDHNYNNWEPDVRDGRITNGIIKFDYVQFSMTKMGAYFSSDTLLLSETAIPMLWWIEIGKERRSGMDTMSFWANCKPVDEEVKESGNWYCYAELDFRLIPTDRDEDCVISWKHTDLFCKATGAAGFYEFDGWNDIRNPINGYIKNDTISVEVVIREMCTFRIREDIKPLSSSQSSNEESETLSSPNPAAAAASSSQPSFSSITMCDLRDSLPEESPFKYKKPDVMIQIGSNRIKCHRSLLSKTLSLRNKLNRIANSLPSNYVIPLTLPESFDIDAFLSICSFLYNDVLILDKHNVGLVFSIATALKIEAVRKACLCVLSPTTVLLVLSELHKICRDDDLYDDCEKAFIDLSKKAIRSKAFKKMEKSLLKKILVIDELKCKEIHLFDAVVEWAKAECRRKNLDENNPNHQKSVLGDCLYNIRFGHMTEKEFKSGPKKSGLLTKDEIKLIKKFIKHKKPKPGFPFPTQPRSPDE
jgi:hypothetical protein